MNLGAVMCALLGLFGTNLLLAPGTRFDGYAVRRSLRVLLNLEQLVVVVAVGVWGL